MKKTLLLSLLLSSTVLAAEQPKPDPRYGRYLSPSGPLTQGELIKLPPRSVPKSGAKAPAAMTASSYTYTYLRCFYRTSTSNLRPTTTYTWARDPNSGDYYRLNGYWWSSGTFDWKNMFYSDVSQSTLNSICQSTLTKQGINKPVAMTAAADNAMSFNYTVWSLDNGVPSGINRMVVFGDSLSDTQNMYNASMWKLPNSSSWYLGRFSNGKNWGEYTAEALGLPAYVWAVGGAAADAHSVLPGVSIPGVTDQVQSWKEYMQRAPGYQPANTLFTMLIGGNDLVNYSKTPDQIIASESLALEALIGAGARNILLLNLPDVSRAPVFKIKGGASTVAGQVVDFNKKLAALAASLSAKYGSSVNIRIFDSYTLFNQVMNSPASFGVSNTTQSCLNITSDSSTNYMSSQTPISACTNPDTFVFWDTLHPTTNTHRLLADKVTQFARTAFGGLPLQPLALRK